MLPPRIAPASLRSRRPRRRCRRAAAAFTAAAALAAPVAAAAVAVLLPCRAALAQSGPAKAYVYVPLDQSGLFSSEGYGVSNGRVVGTSNGGGADEATIWDAATGARLPVSIAGADISRIVGVSGNVAVGSVFDLGTFRNSPAAWDTTTGLRTGTFDLTDLNSGVATGIDGNLAAGSASGAATGGNDQAVVWDLATGTRTLLDTTGLDDSFAYGVSGNLVAGAGFRLVDGALASDALVWDLSANVRRTLSLTGLDYSTASGISGNVAVGWGQVTALNSEFALAWDAATGAQISLARGTLGFSYANAVSGSLIVGGGDQGGSYRAMAWDAATGTLTDLSVFLPSVTEDTEAYGVGVDGSITGYVGDLAFLLRPVEETGGGFVARGMRATSDGDFTQTGGVNTIDGRFGFVEGSGGAGGDTYTLTGGTLALGGSAGDEQAGILGDLVNAGGTVALAGPGGSFVGGDFTQTDAGTLLVRFFEVTVDGATSFEVGELEVGGTIALGGALQVVLPGGFAVTPGQSFSILFSEGPITGGFSSITPGWEFSTFDDGISVGRITFTGVTSAAVPEPGTFALLALAPLGLLTARRRRTRRA